MSDEQEKPAEEEKPQEEPKKPPPHVIRPDGIAPPRFPFGFDKEPEPST